MNRTKILALLTIAAALASPAHAAPTLIGSKVQFDHPVELLAGTRTVTEDIELYECFFQTDICRYGVSYDWGKDFIKTNLFNLLNCRADDPNCTFAIPAGPTKHTYLDMKPNLAIVAVTVIENTFPVAINIDSFTANSISFSNDGFILSPGKVYRTHIGITLREIPAPAPAPLALLGLGLFGLLMTRRCRSTA